MTETHMVTRVELTDLINVAGHAHIYGAKIPDESLRKMLLDQVAKHLRDTEHDSVFISRDLTWAQTTELYHRRQARKYHEGPEASAAAADDESSAIPPVLAQAGASSADAPPRGN